MFLNFGHFSASRSYKKGFLHAQKECSIVRIGNHSLGKTNSGRFSGNIEPVIHQSNLDTTKYELQLIRLYLSKKNALQSIQPSRLKILRDYPDFSCKSRIPIHTRSILENPHFEMLLSQSLS